MRNEIEEFISNVVLNETYNTNVGGNVEASTGYYGYMTFNNESEVDGIAVPEELQGNTVVAIQINDGSIDYTNLTEEYTEQAGKDAEDDYRAHAEMIAEIWFEACEEKFEKWHEG